MNNYRFTAKVPFDSFKFHGLNHRGKSQFSSRMYWFEKIIGMQFFAFDGVYTNKLIFLLIVVLSYLTSCSNKQESTEVVKPQKPNIIFIMADDMGYADAGAYGQKLIKTPNIDQLASEGMRFTQCYSGSSVCAPARSVLMTGQHTGHTRVRGNFGLGGVVGLGGGEGRVPLREEDVTVAQLLKGAGYTTGMVGKWGLGEPNTTGEPGRKGFDEFYGFLNQRRAHTYYPDYIWKNKEKVMLNNVDRKGTDYTHDLFADYTIDFITRNKDKPFFLYIPFCIPHDSYELPDNGEYENKPWDKKAKAYAAMVSRMDKNVGRIIQTLKEAGIDDNTYVFFTSDNGAAESSVEWGLFDSNAPLRGIKRDPYEGGMRVPMIVRNPNKIDAGKTNDLAWYFADVLPTLAEIANVTSPKNIDGVSVLPTLHGKQQDLSGRSLYWEFYEKQGWRATHFGDWKAIQNGMNLGDQEPIELYNLKDDISEKNNLADQHPEIIAKAASIFKESHVPSEHFVWKYLNK
ncbi:MAG: arylsulfatase A-like enzyme [Cyclobacteriaceae bacterium]|jgi:arylsulfatase A-like enzyme